MPTLQQKCLRATKRMRRRRRGVIISAHKHRVSNGVAARTRVYEKKRQIPLRGSVARAFRALFLRQRLQQPRLV